MQTAKAQLLAVVQNSNTSLEDVLFAALEIAAYRERLTQYNPTNVNRINRTQGDSNNIVYNVTLEVQPGETVGSDGSISMQVIDYLVEPSDV